MTSPLAKIQEHLSDLIEGTVGWATHQITEGSFLRSDNRTPIEEYPSGAGRRYELLWTRVSDGLPEVGETNISGDVVDAHCRLELRVAYHAGGGSFGSGDRVGVNREAAIDWHRLRRCLVHSDNYDGANTGIENVRFSEASIAPARGNPDLVVMTIPITVLFRETWTEEPSL